MARRGQVEAVAAKMVLLVVAVQKGEVEVEVEVVAQVGVMAVLF